MSKENYADKMKKLLDAIDRLEQVTDRVFGDEDSGMSMQTISGTEDIQEIAVQSINTGRAILSMSDEDGVEPDADMGTEIAFVMGIETADGSRRDYVLESAIAFQLGRELAIYVTAMIEAGHINISVTHDPDCACGDGDADDES